MKFINSEAIVLKKIDYGESDRSIIIFSKHFGKMNLRVQRIRKSKKRERAAVDVLSKSNFIVYKKEMYYELSSFTQLENYNNIKEDLEKISLSFYVLSILNEVLAELSPNRKMYNLTNKTLSFLNGSDDKTKNLLLILYFMFKTLEIEGFIGSYEDALFLIEESGKNLNLDEKEKIVLKYLLEGKVQAILEEKITANKIKKLIYTFERVMNLNLNTRLNFNIM